MSLCLVTDQKGPSDALLAVMHRLLAPQAAEIGLPDVLLVERGIADVDRIERHGLGERRVIDRLRALQTG